MIWLLEEYSHRNYFPSSFFPLVIILVSRNAWATASSLKEGISVTVFDECFCNLSKDACSP